MMVEQLRRAASGGIGTYVRGLIQGLDTLPRAEVPELELVASRYSGERGEPDRLAWPGPPVRRSPSCPGRC
jgi:hypothetical protein